MGHRKSLTELHDSLEVAVQAVPAGEMYRHYRDNKGEKPYRVVGHAIEEKSEEVLVLYQSTDQIIFSRPLAEFIETVRGGTQKRFQKI